MRCAVGLGPLPRRLGGNQIGLGLLEIGLGGGDGGGAGFARRLRRLQGGLGRRLPGLEIGRIQRDEQIALLDL